MTLDGISTRAKMRSKRKAICCHTTAPTQISVAGGFTHLVPWSYVLLSLAWLVAFVLLGLAIFWGKTRAWRVHIYNFHSISTN